MEKGIRLMEKDGTYFVACVMVGGGKWYLRCLTGGMVSFDFFFIGGVRWVLCMGRSVREGICSRAYILKGFEIFLFSKVFCNG